MAEKDGLLYVGGFFDGVGPAPSQAVVLDLVSGEASTALPTINGEISVVTPDGAGGWYIAGHFTAIGGTNRNGFARFRSDHSLDPDWRPAAVAWRGTPEDIDLAGVSAIAVAGNRVFIGGQFTHIGDVPRMNLAALDAVTGEVIEWNSPANSYVFALEVSANRLFVAGFFNAIGNQSRNLLAALDVKTGQVLPWNPITSSKRFSGYPSYLAKLAVTCDSVYAGGSFTNINGQPRNALVAFDVATGALTPWNPSPTSRGYPEVGISGMIAEGGVVYVAGDFDIIGGQSRTNLAALDAVTGSPLDWKPNLSVADVDFWGGEVSGMAFSGNTVYIAGNFTFVGGQPRNAFAALNATSGNLLPWEPSVLGLGGFPRLAISGNSVFAGGNLSVGGVRRKNLLAFDAATGRVTDWNSDSDGFVKDLKISKDTLYAGGYFTSIGAQPRNGLAAIDVATGSVTDWNPSGNGVIVSLDLLGNVAYVAGRFTSMGGQPRTNLAAVDLTTGIATEWNPRIDPAFLVQRVSAPVVQKVAVSEQAVFIAGNFTNVNGQLRNGLAALHPATGALLPWNPNPAFFDPLFYLRIAVSQNTVYVAGRFTNINGLPRNGLAALDATTGKCLDWNPNPSGGLTFTDTGVIRQPRIEYVFASGNLVYVGGSFDRIGGQARTNIAALDAITGLATDWNPALNGLAFTAAQFGNTVVVGGLFTEIGGRYRPNFAVFPPVGSPVITRQPQGRTVAPGESLLLNVDATGQAPLFFQWKFNGANLLGATNSTLVLTNLQVADSGLYSAVVTNRLGLINSVETRVIVLLPPTIVTQPVSRTVAVGSAVTLRAATTANPPPRYQWRLNGVNLPSATDSTLTLTNLQPSDGGSYSVVVVNAGGSVNSDVAELVVSSPRLPFSDNLRDRVVINSFAGLGSGNSTNATKDVSEPDHVSEPGRKSLWLGWRAPANGVATFGTRGSGFDTLLAVYTNAAPNLPPDYSNLRLVASDDDRGGFLTSEVVFSVLAGTEYLIVIDGFGKSSGNIVLNWKLDTAITDVPRIFQQPLSQTVGQGETVTFSAAAFSTAPLTYQWYQNCMPIAGATNASLTVTNVQTDKVARYRVEVSSGLQVVESAPTFLEINFSGDAGLVQKVASRDKLAERAIIVGGNVTPASWRGIGDQSSIRAVTLKSAFPTPHSALLSPGFGGAPARGFVGTQVFHTFGKTKELGEPNHAGEPGGASAWYSVLAEEDGKMLVSTEGSDFDTVMAVYEGPPNPLGYDELVMPPVASDNNRGFDRKSSRVIFPAARNRTYHIAVDGVNGVQGQVVLTYQLGSPPELTAQPVSGVWKVGNVVILVIQVRSRVPVVYQWQLNGVALAGATNATLVIPVFQSANVGRYSCVVSNFAGVALSSEAVLGMDATEALRLLGRRLPDGAFSVLISVNAASNAVLQVSTNLINWLPIFTNLKSSAQVEFIDSKASMSRWRFYRAVKP